MLVLTPISRFLQELRDMERATQTVFVSNVNLRADDRDVFLFFSKVSEAQCSESMAIIMTFHRHRPSSPPIPVSLDATAVQG